ncbi:MAG: tetratricopeptide repeat protein, partial [Candidatus Krumholzibacteria bacterium]|nr:tetratricopeptide repeat protein [Candidatus Krumholzibacteria bacterium]
MTRLLSIITVLVIATMVGCGGSGDGSVETDPTANIGGSTTDSRGFERKMGPAEIAYATGKQFLSAGNYTEAISNFEKAVSMKPTYLEAWSDLGRAHTDRKD